MRPVRAAGAAVAIALLLAACGSDGDRRATTSTAPTDGHGVTVVTDAGAIATTATPGSSAGPIGDGAASSSSVSTAASATQTADGDAGRTLTLDGASTVGQFAPALLRPGLSSRVVVEVRTPSDAGLRPGSIDHLTRVLAQVSGKPVQVATGPSIRGGARAWSADDLRAEAGAPGVRPQGESPAGDAVLRLLVVHGTFGGDTGVLGVSVQGDTAVVFVDQVEASGSVLTGSEAIESAVVTHEAGHLLGLVDLFLHTGRQDPNHPGHSTNKGSVMYWAVESSLVGQLLGGGPPQDFDADDLADLATIRSG